MAVMTAGSAEHRAAVDELEAGLGPFQDPAWQAELALLADSTRSAAVQWAIDALTLHGLAQRIPRSPGDERGGTAWTSFVREIALARRLGDAAAHAEVTLCLALVRSHPRTMALLRSGQVPAHRARVLVEACLTHPDAVAQAVEARLAGRLDSLTPTRVRQEVDRIALQLDPEAGARQEAAATAGRTAARRTLVHGQGEIVLTGPAAVTQRWWQALTDRARALKAAGDPRTLGALRFDLAMTSDDADRTGDTGGLEPALSDDARCSRPVQAQITVPAATALGLSEEPGWLDGHGWISAPACRRLLTVAELRKACSAPHSGQLIDLADRVVRPQVSPAGLREAIRAMVLTPHELRDVVLDAQPQHDARPALTAFVQARDRFCDGPTGTQVPASRTDADHDRPWPTGPTAGWNLVSRAGRTHQLKHYGWTATRDGTGTAWTSPAGQTARTPAWYDPPPDLSAHAPPDPDELAARDLELTCPPAWASLDLPGAEEDFAPTSAPADRDGTEAGSGPSSGAGTATQPVATHNGWPDVPPF